MANESAAALQNQFALNQLFQSAVAPANAYFAQKTALEIQKAREEQARARQLQDIEAQRAFAVQERQASEIASVRAQATGGVINMALQKAASKDADARQGKAFTQSQAVANQNLANEIRFGRYAQTASALGLDTSTFGEDDAGLVAAYNKATSAKGAMEKVDTDEAANIQAAIGGLLERMRTTGDPERDRAARRAFFTNPEVSNILSKELGTDKFNPAAIEEHINGYDNSVIDRVIESAAETWYGGSSDKIAQSLVSNWGVALQTAQPGYNIQPIMSSIPELMARHKTVLNRGNIRNPDALTRAVTLPLSEYDKKRQAYAAARIKAMQEATRSAAVDKALTNFFGSNPGAARVAPTAPAQDQLRRVAARAAGMAGGGGFMGGAPMQAPQPSFVGPEVNPLLIPSGAKQWNPYDAPSEFMPQPVQPASPITAAPYPYPQVQWAPLPQGVQYDPRRPMF